MTYDLIQAIFHSKFVVCHELWSQNHRFSLWWPSQGFVPSILYQVVALVALFLCPYSLYMQSVQMYQSSYLIQPRAYRKATSTCRSLERHTPEQRWLRAFQQVSGFSQASLACFYKQRYPFFVFHTKNNVRRKVSLNLRKQKCTDLRVFKHQVVKIFF